MSRTTVIHYPLYPDENDNVKFLIESLDKFKNVNSIVLKHLISDLDSNGNPIIIYSTIPNLPIL